MTDKELLRAFKANRSVATFQPILDRYLPFVYASALRQLENESDASEVTTAIFQALANRARTLPRRTILAPWLFRATRLASARIIKIRRGTPVRRTAGLIAPEVLSW